VGEQRDQRPKYRRRRPTVPASCISLSFFTELDYFIAPI